MSDDDEAVIADLTELARAVIRPPYADSDLVSLLDTLRRSAAATLARHGIEYDPAHCPFCEPVVVSSSDDLGGDVCTNHMGHAADCRRKEAKGISHWPIK